MYVDTNKQLVTVKHRTLHVRTFVVYLSCVLVLFCLCGSCDLIDVQFLVLSGFRF